jgi:GDP-L-fucose synthase
MKVLVTGSNGLAGNGLRRVSVESEHTFVFIERKNGDLRNWDAANNIIRSHQPDCVINTAARVGGIGGNQAMHADFLYDNLMINANVLKACAENDVKKVVAFSSVCVFPDNLSLLKEEDMHEGPVFEGNFAYGYAKRMVDVHITALKKQYGVENYCSVIPGNIFGEQDMFSIEHGHVVPSLIHKLYEAISYGTPLEVWGDGRSLREFMYIDDLANLILELISLDQIPQRVIMSGRQQHSIKEIVDMLVDISQFNPDNVIWNISKPNGQRSRPTSKKVVDDLFPDFKYTDIYKGLQKTWDWFCDSHPNVRMEY